MTQDYNNDPAFWLDVLLQATHGHQPGPFDRVGVHAYVDPWIRDAATHGPAVPPLPTLKRFNGFHSL